MHGTFLIRLSERSGGLMFVLWGAEVLQTFLHWWPLTLAGQVVLCVYLLMALRRASRRLLATCLVLLAVAALIIWRWQHVAGLEKGLQSTLHFAAFFAAIQFLRGLSQHIPEVRYTRRAVGRASPETTSVLFLLTGQLFGAIFSGGASFLLASLAPPRASEDTRLAYARNAVLGVGLSIAWSPLFVAMGLVVSLAHGVQIWQLMALGVLPVAAVLAARCIAIAIRRPVDIRQVWRPLLPILKLILPLVAAVALLQALTGLSNLTVVALIVPCIAALASLARPEISLRVVGRQTQAALSNLKDEVLLVAVALLLGQIAVASPELVQLLADGRLQAAPPVVYLLASAGIVFLGGFVGLHPLLTVSISLPIIQSMAGDKSTALLLSASALIGWAGSAVVSRWAVPVLVAGHAFQVPVRRLSYGRNLGYAIIYILIGIAFLQFVSIFIL